MRVAVRERESRGRLEADRLRVEQEKARSRDQLMALDRLAMLGTLSAGITHELNSPLSAILGFTEVALEKDCQPADARRFFSRIQNCARRCSQIMKDMLAFSRQRTGQPRLCDVNALLRECLQLKEHDWLVYGLQVETDLAEGLPPVMISSGEFQQVIFNLLTNAQQAICGPGRKGGLIRLHSRLEGTRVLVSVQDNGPGVPPELAERIWEPFFTTKPEGEGTGLGLAICRQIILRQGGSLAMEEAPGGGAEFRVLLPLSAPVLPGGLSIQETALPQRS